MTGEHPPRHDPIPWVAVPCATRSPMPCLAPKVFSTNAETDRQAGRAMASLVGVAAIEDGAQPVLEQGVTPASPPRPPRADEVLAGHLARRPRSRHHPPKPSRPRAPAAPQMPFPGGELVPGAAVGHGAVPREVLEDPERPSTEFALRRSRTDRHVGDPEDDGVLITSRDNTVIRGPTADIGGSRPPGPTTTPITAPAISRR